MTPPEEPSLLPLMRELADAVGTLIGGHVRLARVELGDEARRYARRAAFVGTAAGLLTVGWALACVAGALALARHVDPPLAFLAVGGVHLVGAGVGLGLLLLRPVPRPFDDSLTALDRTVQTVATIALGATGAPDARSVSAPPVQEPALTPAAAPPARPEPTKPIESIEPTEPILEGAISHELT
jgi:hypothetical protein